MGFGPAATVLGIAADVLAGEIAAARGAMTDAIARNPENGYALHGLAAAQSALGKAGEAESTRERLARAWRDADVTLTSSRF
ncbi:MAG: hypothetical protein FJ197_02105 [Gammaproteobacteria bacterium]|nr:hypothetical protein [Gammaproteobacteria bacterium]